MVIFSIDTTFIISVLVLLSMLILGVFVYINNKQGAINKSFLALTFSSIIWITAVLVIYSSKTYLVVLISARLAFGGAILIGLSLFYFSYYFPKNNSYKLRHVLVIIPAILILSISLFTPYLIEDIHAIENTKYGQGYYLFVIYFFTTLGVSIFNQISKRNYLDTTESIQAKYVLTGLSITIIIALTTNLIIPMAIGTSAYSKYGPLATIFFIIFTAYAITKHHLFNIKVIATEILTALMAIMLLVRIPLSKTPGELAFNLVFFHIFLVLGILLIRTVWQEIHRAQEVEKLNREKIDAYDKIASQAHNLQLLQKVSDIILKSFGEKLPNLTQKVLNIAAKDISYCSTILLGLITEDKKYLQAYGLSENKFSTFIINHLDRPFQEHRIKIEGAESNLFLQSHLNKKLIAGNKFVDFVNPPVPRAIAEVIQKALGIKSVVSFPVLKGDESVGIMGFMLNKPKEEIVEEDYHLLKAMADQISLAIEKTSVYKELEQKIEDLKQANSDLQKLLDMKTEFMRVASHQLRTPISSVRGILSMLNEGGLPPEKNEEFLKLAYESADKLSAIIKDILSATSLEAGRLDLQFQKTDITKILDESVKERKLLVAGKPIKLNFEPPADIPEVKADPYWMKEVFNNLIDNAIFYTPKGEVSIGVSDQPANVAVTIKDTGVGITAEDKERLFKKFTRGQNAMSVHPNGSGLGLYIAKNIMDLHQGKIDIESAGKDKGTTIKVELPK